MKGFWVILVDEFLPFSPNKRLSILTFARKLWHQTSRLKIQYLVLSLLLSQVGFTQDVNKIVKHGHNLYVAGDYKGALVCFNKAILLEPDAAELYLSRGTIKGVLDDYQGAINDLNLL